MYYLREKQDGATLVPRLMMNGTNRKLKTRPVEHNIRRRKVVIKEYSSRSHAKGGSLFWIVQDPEIKIIQYGSMGKFSLLKHDL